MLVMQDVPVDGTSETRTSGTARRAADDAVNDHARGGPKHDPDRAGQ